MSLKGFDSFAAHQNPNNSIVVARRCDSFAPKLAPESRIEWRRRQTVKAPELGLLIDENLMGLGENG
jgi:hypothetical protein